MIRAIAIDDEPLALQVTSHFCSQAEGVDLVRTFTKTSDAAAYLKKHPVDLLFLDIQMPGKNGLEFYRTIGSELPVIFTTAYSQYAVEGFNVNAIDYLLKPFSLERFLQALDKAKKQLQQNTTEHPHLLIRANYKLQRVDFDNIMLIEGLDDYIKIHLQDKTSLVTRMPMKSIAEKLPSSDFVRVHRSYIVPVKKIMSIYNNTIKMDDFVIPIGNTYRKEVSKHFSL